MDSLTKFSLLKLPVNDILWHCIVAPFLEIEDIGRLEIALTNREYRRHLSRDGIFTDIDWDTEGVPVTIKRIEQVNWLNKRQIRLYNVKCINITDEVIQMIVSMSRNLLHTIDISSCNHYVVSIETLRIISQYSGVGLRKVKANGCTGINTIVGLTSRCQGLESLILDSCYRLKDEDCRFIARGDSLSTFQ